MPLCGPAFAKQLKKFADLKVIGEVGNGPQIFAALEQ